MDSSDDPSMGDGQSGDGASNDGSADGSAGDGTDGTPDQNDGASSDGESDADGEDEGPFAVCGDSEITGPDETCDDGNDAPNDGCDASCRTQIGWTCAAAGSPCLPAACGDGIVAGIGAFGEQCDDHNAASLDGCSRECQVEPGWICPDGITCHRVVCGDGVVEGDEACEDGNTDPFDSCSSCQLRPSCGVGPCEVVCGDGMIFPSEECDDGNALDGDGCSATCVFEPGFYCVTQASALGDTLVVPAVFRDFAGFVATGYETLKHPDFSDTVGSQGVSYGMVGDTLDANGLPVYTGVCQKGQESTTNCKADGTRRWQTHSKELFDQWYAGGPFASELVSSLTLTRATGGTGKFGFDSSASGGFFPLDGAGWVREGKELADPGCAGGHNFGFTSEVRDWFTFRGGETLTFAGDDDVWVFIGGKLALDLGGVHGQTSASITLSVDGQATCVATTAGACVQPTRALGLVAGQVYEIALFHAERRGCGANFRLELAGFERSRTSCEEVCGDGIVTPGEECDDANTNDQDECTNQCTINIIPQ